MVAAALADGTADRDCVFEVFARRLPHGRRYGVVAGTARLLEVLPHFRFGDRRAGRPARPGADRRAAARLAGRLPVQRRHRRLRRGRPLLPGLAGAHRAGPVRRGRAAGDPRAVGAQPRQRDRLRRRPDGRRGVRAALHRDGLPPHPRGGGRRRGPRRLPRRLRVTSSNLEAGRRYGVPTTGTSAHAFTLLHDDEAAAFRAQVATLGAGTTLLVDTYDVDQGIRDGGRGGRPGARRRSAWTPATCPRSPPTPASCSTHSGATTTRIVVTSDLDEYAIAGLMAAPVDGYGVGTSLVTGSGAPDGRHGLQAGRARTACPVAKKSKDKVSVGGRKYAVRRHDADGTATAEVVSAPADRTPRRRPRPRRPARARRRAVPGADARARPSTEARAHHERARTALPPEAWALSRGEPALETLEA